MNKAELAKQELEWRKCEKDPVYFINNYCYMWTKDGGDEVQWNLWEPQEDSIQKWFNGGNFIILKTRQLGISWTAVGYAIHGMIFRKNYKVYFASYNESAVIEQFERIRFIYEYLPEWMKSRVIIGGYGSLGRNLKNNTKIIEFSNGSSIKAVASARSSGHGSAPSLYIMDEFARHERADYAWRAVLPAIKGGGQVIVISTANGQGNKFHNLWVEAEAGKSTFKPLFYPASTHPLYTEEFLKEAKRDFVGDDVGYYEAYPMTSEQAFMTSDTCPFDGERINWHMRYISENDITPKVGNLIYNDTGKLEFKENPRGNLEIWKMPELNGINRHSYTIGADVAEGIDARKGDYSVASVIDATTHEVVALYRARIPQESYSVELYKLGKFYGDAWLAVESNKYSDIIINDLKGQYLNFYMREVRDTIWDKPTMKPGFFTDAHSKNRIILQFRRYFSRDTNPLRIYSRTLLQEMTTYKQFDDKTLGATSGNYDDCVMATAIAIEAMESMPLVGAGEYIPACERLDMRGL